jgi:hypothetical protein
MSVLAINNRIEMLKVLDLENKSCVEIGVFDGGFSQEIFSCKPSMLYLIDPWKHQDNSLYPDDKANVADNSFESIYQSVQTHFAYNNNVVLIRKESYDAVDIFQDKSLDFVYVDAIHTFESCFCDMVVWYKKVKHGGWLCGHDYTGDYPGVRRAVDAFCKITGKELSLITLEPWASWGIKK